MASTPDREQERQQLWAEYETALWSGLGVIKRQASVTGAEMEELAAAHRKVLRILGRLRELQER